MRVDIPHDAAPGEYQGVVTVRAGGVEPTPVRLLLSIGDRVARGPRRQRAEALLRHPLAQFDAGDRDEPVAPYTPLVVEGKTIRCLGREIQFAAAACRARNPLRHRELLAGR